MERTLARSASPKAYEFTTIITVVPRSQDCLQISKNVMGSSIARESDAVLYTHAGPEIAVASTKAYTSQLTALCLLTLYLAERRQWISPARRRTLVAALGKLPAVMRRALATGGTAKGRRASTPRAETAAPTRATRSFAPILSETPLRAQSSLSG
ncbi:MAG: SIS domain-containing protein [Gemmatimonadetes bacterium]|nr:SIS domain-containing protein [Gemmatimonadota bacterium]